MRMKKPGYIHIIGLILLVLVVAFLVAVHMWMHQIDQKSDPLFTVYPCITDPASWNGLSPGVSTRADVVERLGEPNDENYHEEYDYGWLTYLPENAHLSKIRPEYWSYVYIDSETETVLWIDEHVSNADGQFHLVAEGVDEYGELFDQIYWNGLMGNYGTGQHIYVWAGCGLALNAVPEGHARKNPDEPVSAHAPERPIDSYRLYQRFPWDEGAYSLRRESYNFNLPWWKRLLNTKEILEDNPDFSYIQPDAKHVIWRRIYFAPSSYAEFEQAFQNSTRIRFWGLPPYRLLD